MNEHKIKLEEEHDLLVKELKTIAVQNSETGDWVAQPEKINTTADENVGADIAEDWNERRAIVGQLEMRYHNVVIALKKFADNTYGKCELCNEEIETDRLNANSAARTCKIHLERERSLPY
jgi:RNA polymerase-binding transcription factor DksA